MLTHSTKHKIILNIFFITHHTPFFIFLKL
nr:MAG TPA: hypothetical protein [Caudoviricetes sp.]